MTTTHESFLSAEHKKDFELWEKELDTFGFEFESTTSITELSIGYLAILDEENSYEENDTLTASPNEGGISPEPMTFTITSTSESIYNFAFYYAAANGVNELNGFTIQQIVSNVTGRLGTNLSVGDQIQITPADLPA